MSTRDIAHQEICGPPGARTRNRQISEPGSEIDRNRPITSAYAEMRIRSGSAQIEPKTVRKSSLIKIISDAGFALAPVLAGLVCLPWWRWSR